MTGMNVKSFMVDFEMPFDQLKEELKKKILFSGSC
jgi:hypothetical protein